MHHAKTRLPAAFLGLILLTGMAPAQVVSYLTPIDPTLALPAAAEHTLQLPAFDASLGTLTGVTFSFTGFTAQLAKGENLGAASAYSYNVTSTLTLERTGGPALFAFDPVVLAGSGSLAAFDGGYDFSGPSSFNSTVVTTPLSGIYEVPEALLASYIGLLPIDFTASLAGSSLVSSPGNFLTQTSNEAGGTLEVTYTYALIPEPSSYAAMVGLAVLGFVTFRRRLRTAG